MALDLDVDVGTNSSDVFDDIADFSVSIGLRGNDVFFADSKTGFVVLLGGEDNDSYTVTGSALIYDVDGADTIQLPDIDLDDSYIVTLDHGRHAFVYDTESHSSIVLLDVDSEAASNDWIQFDGFGTWLDDFFDNIESFDGFIGDFNWSTLGQLGLPSIPNGDVNDALNAAYAAADHAQERGDISEVALLYEAALDRTPDIGGLNFWFDVFEGGQSFKDLAFQFLDNNEFQQKFGDVDTLSPEEFVNRLYQNVLGRDADASGAEFWTSKIEQGADYADVLLAFADSAENVAQATYLDFLQEVSPGEWDWV
ncbi:MAG: DUF4214 domain-containing protein [Rhizobiaceae bacterium]|nr:DUF4214 domain-containing protein [Rhizobiaceae bacterium]